MCIVGHNTSSTTDIGYKNDNRSEYLFGELHPSIVSCWFLSLDMVDILRFMSLVCNHFHGTVNVRYHSLASIRNDRFFLSIHPIAESSPFTTVRWIYYRVVWCQSQVFSSYAAIDLNRKMVDFVYVLSHRFICYRSQKYFWHSNHVVEHACL